MGKPPGFREDYESPNLDHEQDMAEHGASPKTAKWLYVVIIVLVVALALLVGVALHIPNGDTP